MREQINRDGNSNIWGENESSRCMTYDVPCGVKDLLVEVEAVHVDLVLLALAASTHLKERDVNSNIWRENQINLTTD
jgi:hypothetical protein